MPLVLLCHLQGISSSPVTMPSHSLQDCCGRSAVQQATSMLRVAHPCRAGTMAQRWMCSRTCRRGWPTTHCTGSHASGGSSVQLHQQLEYLLWRPCTSVRLQGS
jgi:hypothetical protein